MIEEEMRGRAVVNAWDHEAGYTRWFYRVSHPILRPVQAAEEPPRPPNLERSLEAGEAEERTPIYDIMHRLLGFVEPTL
ncbi:hypothetical protein A2U01_0033471, partial [Trifolium medium]|nr:hypothetical protein [Trifolium medium]